MLSNFLSSLRHLSGFRARQQTPTHAHAPTDGQCLCLSVRCQSAFMDVRFPPIPASRCSVRLLVCSLARVAQVLFRLDVLGYLQSANKAHRNTPDLLRVLFSHLPLPLPAAGARAEAGHLDTDRPHEYASSCHAPAAVPASFWFSICILPFFPHWYF